MNTEAEKAKAQIEKFKESATYQAVTYFSGSLKQQFLRDIEKGEKPAHLLRDMAKFYYANKKSSY